MSAFKVRIYVNGTSPLVVDGGVDPMGAYVELRPASKERPGLRVNPAPGTLRQLPQGSDAEFELVTPIPSDKL